MSAQDAQRLLRRYAIEIESALEEFVDGLPDQELYRAIAYTLGFADERLAKAKGRGGKRLRPALTLLLADWYGKKEQVLPAALSIELFHNFTLVHDDIVDEDEYRRRQATLWKLKGIPQAINAGDALFNLAHRVLHSIEDSSMRHDIVPELLLEYQKVIEGQHLDLTLAEIPLKTDAVSKDVYFEMIGKKTGALIGAATKIAGAAAGRGKEECDLLYRFGVELGVSYQLADDLISIWGENLSIRRSYNDLRKRKKTFPVIHAFSMLPAQEQTELVGAYGTTEEMPEDTVHKVIGLLNETSARKETEDLMREHIELSKQAARALSLSAEQKNVLCAIVDSIIPMVRVK